MKNEDRKWVQLSLVSVFRTKAKFLLYVITTKHISNQAFESALALDFDLKKIKPIRNRLVSTHCIWTSVPLCCTLTKISKRSNRYRFTLSKVSVLFVAFSDLCLCLKGKVRALPIKRSGWSTQFWSARLSYQPFLVQSTRFKHIFYLSFLK